MPRPEKPAPRESAPRKFKSIEIPADLVGKTIEIVQFYLNKRPGFAGRLATADDLIYIQANADQYRNLQKPTVRHNAFGSTVELGGGPSVPYVLWSSDGFACDGYWIGHDTLRSDRVLLRA